MRIQIEVTEAELLEMECTAEDLRASVASELDGGIDVPNEGGTIYLNGFTVDIDVKP